MLQLMEDRKHFSYNQLITMLACPYRYYLQYVEERGWDYVPSSLSFGTAIHESISVFHISLQDGGIRDINQFTNAFHSRFDEEVTENNVMFKDGNEYDELLIKGEKLVIEYVNTFGTLRPAEIEMEFRLPLVDTYTGTLLEKDVVGKVDLITAEDEIHELKTSSSSIPESSVEENLQLVLYGWSFKMLFGKEPSKLVLINMVKSKQPKIQVLNARFDAVKERKLLNLMLKVNEAIEKQIFYPNPKGTYGCNSCCYSLNCEYAF